MKKIVSIVLCLVLIGTVLTGTVQPVKAAGSAHMSILSSTGTVYRGDTFTLTVSLSNDQPVSNGGVMLSYDSSMFEFLGGSCHVSNATLSEVSAARGGGVFVLQTDEVVSGTIFTINMRVNDSASFGTYSISGTPSLSVACSLSGTSITVACSHSYDNCTNVDGNNHECICTICGQKKTESHTWNSGTVTQAATCKDTGTSHLTCTGCGATKDETIPVTNEHTYGSWSKISNSQHIHTCSLCGKTENAGHTWNGGTVTKKATCKDTGTKRLTCTGCGATKDETIPVADHAYGECTYVDEAGHNRTCADCGKVLTEDHAYGESWEHDENWHFLRCEGCGNVVQQSGHTPGPKATEQTDQVCIVCDRILRNRTSHVHSFAETWSTDETNHWYACADCEEKDSVSPHVFDDHCDADCNTCGMIRQPNHVTTEDWSSDETGHWYTCADCGEQMDFDTHTAGPEATISSAQVCTVCGFEIAPVLPHDHVYDAQGTHHSHTCACGEAYEAEAADCAVCAQFPWWIVCIVEAVVFCGVLAGLYVWLKKRGIRLF